MTDQWRAVDHYLCDHLIENDPVLLGALARSDAAGLPAINVAPNQGKLLHLYARMIAAGRILEIGTLGGYSAIWLARALRAGGRLVTLELDPKHADVARANLDAAGLHDRAEVRVGPALASLDAMIAAGEAPFDFIFIDADKRLIPEYYERALTLARSGTLIVVDNVVRGGAVIDADTADPSVEGVRRFMAIVRTDRRVTATAVQTVGIKGYDGFALLIVA